MGASGKSFASGANNVRLGSRTKLVEATVALSLDRLTRISARAAAESGQLVDDSRVHDLSDLYVERDIESELLRMLNSSVKTTVLSGGAGTGKTSLLWHLYNRLHTVSNRLVVFLRAETLAALDPEELAVLVKEIDRTSGAPVALVDTADAVLTTPSTRATFLEAVDILNEFHFSVLITCRKEEASLFLSEFKINTTFLEERYSDRELVQIIETHAAYFYGASGSESLEARVAEIGSIVAQQKPVGDLATRPLLLRMLFALYAPHEIPSNINIGQLYADFWNRRVRTDWRAGRPEPEVSSTDLCEAAVIIAYQMIRKGVIRLADGEAVSILTADDREPDDLRQLVSRGILRNVSGEGVQNSIEFFHQTFLEHAAARALILEHGKDAVSLLIDFLRNHPEDYLRYPVLEHLLQISQSEPFPVQLAAQTAMESLLEHGPPHLSAPALAAFIQMAAPTERLQEVALLSLKDRRLALSYIQATASAPLERWNEMWLSLKRLWLTESESEGDRDIWSHRTAILKQIPRFARSDDALAQDISSFMDHECVYESVDPATVYIAVKAFDALGQGAATVSLLNKLLERLQRAGETSKSEALVLLALAKCPDVLPHLHSVQTSLRRLGTTESADRIRGAMRAFEWRRQSVSVEMVLQNEGQGSIERLSEIAAWLSEESDDVWDRAWNHFEGISDSKLVQEWVKRVWDRLGVYPLDKTEIPAIRAARYLARQVASRLIGSEDNRDGALAICRYSRSFALRIALLQAWLETASIRLEDFSSGRAAGFLLGPAIAILHEAALAVLQEEPNSLSKEIRTRLVLDFEAIVSAAPMAVDHFVPILVTEGEFERVERPVETGLIKLGTFDKETSLNLHRQITLLLASETGARRQTGARWAYFAAEQIRDLLTFESIHLAISIENDPRVLVWLARAMCSLASTEKEIRITLTWARKAIASEDKYSRDKLFESWVDFILRHQRVEEIEAVLEVAQLAECNLKRVRDIAKALPRLCQFDRARAAQLAVSLLTFPWLQGRKAVLGSFRRETLRSFTDWSRQADIEDIKRTLARIPEVNSEIGCMIIKLSYILPHKVELAQTIIHLLDIPELSADVKHEVALILRARNEYETIQWNIPASPASLARMSGESGGPGTSQGIFGAVAGGNITQIIFSKDQTGEQSAPVLQSGQVIEDVSAGGRVAQSTQRLADAQEIRSAEAHGDITQRKMSMAAMSFRWGKATGWGIVGLGLVFLGFLAYRFIAA